MARDVRGCAGAAAPAVPGFLRAMCFTAAVMARAPVEIYNVTSARSRSDGSAANSLLNQSSGIARGIRPPAPDPMRLPGSARGRRPQLPNRGRCESVCLYLCVYTANGSGYRQFNPCWLYRGERQTLSRSAASSPQPRGRRRIDNPLGACSTRLGQDRRGPWYPSYQRCAHVGHLSKVGTGRLPSEVKLDLLRLTI